MIGDVAALAVANACLFVAGAGVLRLIGTWARVSELRRCFALAYVAGLASVGVAAPLLLLAGASLETWQVLALCGALGGTGLVRAGRAPAHVDQARPVSRWITWPSLTLGAVVLGLLAIDFVYQPLAAWDAWAQWTAKAKSIVIFDGLDADVFASPAYRRWNPEYPLLLPAIEAIGFRFMGGFNTQVIHLQFWFVLAGFVGALYEALRRRAHPIAISVAVLMVLVAPNVHLFSAYAQADIPLAAFVALAGVFGWIWLVEDDPRTLILFALFAAAALATKMEARIYIPALAAALAVVAFRASRRRALAVGAATATAAVVAVVPWAAWVARHHVTGRVTQENAFDPGFLATHGDRIPLATATLARELVDPTSWLLIFPVAMAACALAFADPNRRQIASLFSMTAVATFAGLVWLYWWTPLDPHYHLLTSGSRVVTSLVLLAAALTPVLLSRPGAPSR